MMPDELRAELRRLRDLDPAGPTDDQIDACVDAVMELRAYAERHPGFDVHAFLRPYFVRAVP